MLRLHDRLQALSVCSCRSDRTQPNPIQERGGLCSKPDDVQSMPVYSFDRPVVITRSIAQVRD
jgi:hypothetical protein